MKNRQIPQTGFSLIELLVVISIIALLLSIITPGLNRASAMAQRVVCVSNNRQWTIGTAHYAADWNNLLPRVTCSIDQVRNSSFFRNVTSYASWPNRGDKIDYDLVSIFIQPYVGEPQFMECPSRRD